MSEPEYALGRTVGVYERLIEQAEFMRPLTGRMLNSAGVRPRMHVLDVGCGVGDVSALPRAAESGRAPSGASGF